MIQPLCIQHNQPLGHLNSFGISVNAKQFVELHHTEQLPALQRLIAGQEMPALLLGGGSNLLLLEDYAGLVVYNRLSGHKVIEHDNYLELQVQAGEDWPTLVEWSVAQGYQGLENLADIPGSAGAAPVQNIGAYGLELADVCQGVEYLDLTNGELVYLTTEDCHFAYRHSIFKQQLKQHALITRIDLCLTKHWMPKLSYAPLNTLPNNCSAAQVFALVRKTRQAKLPDPKLLGNAGSFFKNPIVSENQLETLLQANPQLPHYPAGDRVFKVAAGWLIDQLGLKAYQHGGAAVHQRQALVLVNKGNASGADILRLCQHIRQKVFQHYRLVLEPEVRFISANGEVDPSTVLGSPEHV